MWRWVTRGGLVLGCLLLFIAPVQAADFVGFIERPAAGQTVYGMVLVQGWALANQDISKVDLYVDDQFQQSADYGLARADVQAAYPNWPGIQNRKPGFQTGFTASRFSNGAHTIYLQVTTGDGTVHEVGRRTIIIDNTINQPPFGYVEHPDNVPAYDAHGSFQVSGWVTDTDGIKEVDVLADNEILQAAIYGSYRPDIGNSFPDFPAASFSGFVSNVDTTTLVDGVHTISVRATDMNGLSRTIGTRTVQVYNSDANLQPFGFLETPLRDSVLYGTGCSSVPTLVSPYVPLDISHHITPVRGWALDLGSRSNTGRVSYVELLVDGVRWYSTDDCQWVDSLGAYVNCYGFNRPDVARLYPTYPDSPRAGFEFSLDVGTLMALGVPPGQHTLKLRIGDEQQTFADVPGPDGIPVFFTCATADHDYASQGFIEFPTPFAYASGTATFRGWAIDENDGVQNVEIWVDGTFSGLAAYGSPRPDVNAVYPTVSGSYYSGWSFNFDTTQLSDGHHRLTVRVLDRDGHYAEIGSADFLVDNAN